MSPEDIRLFLGKELNDLNSAPETLCNQIDVNLLIENLIDASEQLKKLFSLKIINEIKCVKCQNISKKCIDSSNGLHVALIKEDPTSIDTKTRYTLAGNSVAELIKNHRISIFDQKCPKCNGDQNIYENYGGILPDILKITIKRFVQGKKYPIKLKEKIYPDSNLILNNTAYTLSCIITHAGRSSKHGHYNCSLKRPDGTWDLIDDMNDSVIKDTGHPTDGYIFLYQKDNHVDLENFVKVVNFG